MSKRKKRNLPKTIFIACEGTNTEPTYFERIKEEIEDNDQYVLTVYPDKNEERPKTDALGLVREARSRSADFDEVWAVFDKNGYTLHETTFNEAAKIIDGKQVNIAFSSIAFEHWILLHFEQNRISFQKSECKDDKDKSLNCGTGNHQNDCQGNLCVAGYLRQSGYYPNYAKKSTIDTYTFLKDKMERAFENTAWLKKIMEAELIAAQNNIFNVNPFCTVDRLVKKLLGIQDSIICIVLHETVNLNGLIFQFFKVGSDFKVSLTNNTNRSLLINNANLITYFKVQSQTEESLPLILANLILIPQNQSDSFTLFTSSQCSTGKMTFFWEQIKLICYF